MRITRYTDYALRVMIYLAQQGGQLCTIQQIASAHDISKNHLMKVVQQLNRLGYLQATRGKNGGIKLHRSPSDINIGTLIRDMEQDFSVVECLDSNSHCNISGGCKLKGVFKLAVANFLNTFDQHSLADMLPPEAAVNTQGLLTP